MYEQLLALDQVKINFSATGSHVLNIILALIMFGVALDIRPREFKPIFQQPKSLLVSLLGQLVFLPLLTFLIVVLFRSVLSPTVSLGMILVSACPGGNISNFISQYSKANIELSVSLTAISTLLALIMTPFNFAFYGGLYFRYISNHTSELLQPIQIDPFQMFYTVFILLGIPLILGQLMVKFKPKMASKIAPIFQRFSIFAFIAMVVIAFSNNMEIFKNYIFYIFFIVLIHNGLALLTGFSIGSFFKLPKKDRRTATIEVGIQNSGLGLALLLNPKIFPEHLAIGGMLMITAWWGIWHIVSGLTLGTYWHKHPVKE